MFCTFLYSGITFLKRSNMNVNIKHFTNEQQQHFLPKRSWYRKLNDKTLVRFCNNYYLIQCWNDLAFQRFRQRRSRINSLVRILASRWREEEEEEADQGGWRVRRRSMDGNPSTHQARVQGLEHDQASVQEIPGWGCSQSVQQHARFNQFKSASN